MKTTPKDFFLWLATMAALLASTISLLALWFEYIDRFWGDAAVMYGNGYSGGIITSLSVLIVIFPIYVWFTKMLHDDQRSNPEKKDLWVRRWLIVATIAVAALTLVIDLIVLLQTFLGGEELTATFLLKVVSIFVVVGGVLLYYLNEIKGTWNAKKKESQIIGVVVSLIVVISIMSAFLIIGSPRTQRVMRYDSQKISDLQSIQSNLISIYQQTGNLPESLEAMRDPLSWFVVPVDPQSKEKADDGTPISYVYSKTSNTTFTLCAYFNLPSFDANDAESPYAVPVVADPALEYWKHDAGKVCFDRTIDPLKYPVNEKVIDKKI